MSDPVRVERTGPVTTVILTRPEARNSVNGPTATALYAAFDQFDREPTRRQQGCCGQSGQTTTNDEGARFHPNSRSLTAMVRRRALDRLMRLRGGAQPTISVRRRISE